MKLNIKIIMGLIIATSMGFLLPLCASSPTPPTENTIIQEEPAPPVAADAVQITRAAAQAEAAEIRYHLPARARGDFLRLLDDTISDPRVMFDFSITIIGFAALYSLWLHYEKPSEIYNTTLANNQHFKSWLTAAFILGFVYGRYFTMKGLIYLLENMNGPHTLAIPHHAPILQADCTICHEPLLDDPAVPQQQIFATNCNAEAPTGNAHLLHKSCLQAWFDRRKAQVADLDLLGRVAFGAIQQCPTCRTEVADPGLVTITAPDNQPAAQPAHAHTD
jgi:hypothetical protein